MLPKATYHPSNKTYELTNHLGNVMSTISDRKVPVGTTITHFLPDVDTYQDYFPFGMVMSERSGSEGSAGYRFGFNGMEYENELYQPGNAYDFGARVYDGRIGRWFSVDPLAAKYPDLSPYAFVANSPLVLIDPDGKENVIYLVYLPSDKNKLSKEDAQGIADQVNKNFENLGLKTRVVLVDMSDPENSNFDPCNIDDTDAIAVVGEKNDVIDFIYTKDQDFGEQLKTDWQGGYTNPEKSENSSNEDNSYGGEWIAIDANGIEGWANLTTSSISEAGAGLIAHGAGHNAGINHSYDGTTRSSTSLIMSDGNRLIRLLTNGQHTYMDVFGSNELDALGKPRNDDYIKSMKDRFGDNEAKANELQ